jgi:hypothetical protein
VKEGRMDHVARMGRDDLENLDVDGRIILE